MTTDSIAHPAASVKIYGLVLALVWFALDQVTKWWILEGLTSHGAIHITPFFNLVLGWNRGISFGILGGHDLPPWILALFAGSIAGGLIIWLLQTHDRLVATGLALIIGGALGNALDRLRHGAVTDFLDFHLAGWHWPAFNFADVGIVSGAGLLILDTFIRRHSGAVSQVSDRQP
jgi:signal peptidase II